MQNRPKIAFFGTPDFAVTVLRALKKCGIMPDAIVTSPDKPKGRNLVLTPPPVKVWADENGMSVFQPEKLAGFSLPEKYDLFILAAYGKMIPKEILAAPKYGTLNVHPSLLPKWRGASPIQSAILAGDKETGVSIMLLDEEMDHGPILATEKIPLEKWSPDYLKLEEKAGEMGGKMLCEIIPKWIKGEIKPVPQDHVKATYCRKIKKEDGSIEPLIILGKESNAEKVTEAERKVRALNPDPGTFTILKIHGKDIRIKIKKAHVANSALIPDLVIPEGKKEMSWSDFLKGHPIN